MIRGERPSSRRAVRTKLGGAGSSKASPAVLILIADDHSLVRDAVAAYLKAADDQIDVVCVGSFDDAQQALSGADRFEVLLLDMSMPGMKGLATAVSLKDAFPRVRVALLSGSVEPGLALSAMKAGLDGFVPKTLSGPALVSVVQLIACGERYFPADQLEQHLTTAADPLALASDELEVLMRLRAGLSNKEIAKRTGLEEGRVKTLVRRLAKRFSARNRTETALKSVDVIP